MDLNYIQRLTGSLSAYTFKPFENRVAQVSLAMVYSESQSCDNTKLLFTRFCPGESVYADSSETSHPKGHAITFPSLMDNRVFM